MTLPLMAASAGGQSGRRIAGAAFLSLLLLVQAAGEPARAQETDPFSATVKVDARADTAAKAREAARVDGQRRALAAIAERLRAAGRRPKLPKLDDKAITDLVASFEVANERMSAVRYLADYTFHFRPAETRRVLGVAATGAANAPRPPRQPARRQAGRGGAVRDTHRDHPRLPVGRASGIVGGSQPVARGLGLRAGNTGAAPSSRSAMPAISPRSTPARRVPATATRSRRSPAAMAARRRLSRLRSCRAHPIVRPGSMWGCSRYRDGRLVGTRSKGFQPPTPEKARPNCCAGPSPQSRPILAPATSRGRRRWLFRGRSKRKRSRWCCR